jgi:hypothetical protein
MKLQFLAAAAAAALTLSTAGAALAADVVTAKLAQPVAAKTKLIAGGAVFLCEGDACTASASNPRTLTAGACKDLVKEVGAVSSYGGARRQLDADKLGQCNASAATQVAKQ